MESSFFNRTEEAPADPIFQKAIAFKEDKRESKVNLSVGLYQDESLQTPILKTVKAAEKYLLSHETTKEYLPISGDPLYLEESGRLIFGDALWKNHHEKICGVQAPGGTGGLRIGAELLFQEVGKSVLIPDPTWPNHVGVFKRCGYKVERYPYDDIHKHQLNFEAILKELRSASPNTIVIFHACCHNPTGADPSKEEWAEIGSLLREKKLFPFFDFAYQGLGKNLDDDAYILRLFLEQGLEYAVSFSYSKSFGLYSERVGGVFVIAQDKTVATRILSQLKIFARTNYSNPPRHGASIVAHILSHPELKTLWEKEVANMRARIDRLRIDFITALQSKQKIKDFSCLFSRHGMFCFLGLTSSQVAKLEEDHGIYMAEGGRINLAGLSEKNVRHVAGLIAKVL